MKLQFILFLFSGVVTEIWACGSCGIRSGGPMVQAVSKKFEWIGGLYYRECVEILVFVDRYNSSIVGYHFDSGRTHTIELQELEDEELAAIIPIKQHEKDEQDGKLKYIIAANQSLYKFEGKLYEPYTLEKIMDITDESKFLCEAAIDKNGNIVIGTRLAEFQELGDDFKKGSAEYYHVNVADNSKKVIVKGHDITGGVCFNKYYTKMYTLDVYRNKIYSFKYNVANGEASDQKEIFDLKEYNETRDADIHGHLFSIIMDLEDNLWIGLLHSYEILVFNPHKQMIIKRVSVPGSMHTSLDWAGDQHDILFVGSAEQPQGGAGSLIAISNTGHRGWPSHQIEL